MSLEVTRSELQKAKSRLGRYQAVLRLANTEIEQRNQMIFALTTFSSQASRAGQFNAVLKLALVQALETIKAPVGAVILIHPETKELSLGVHKGLTPALIDILTGQELAKGAAALMPHLVVGDGALLEYDTADDPKEQLLLTNGQLTSLVSLPLQADLKLLGTLLVGLQDKKVFKPSELCFLLALSQETAIFLDSLHLRKALWHTAESLLGEEVGQAEVKLKEIEPDDLDLAKTPLWNLIADTPVLPQPAGDDLEQLLAAMMEAEDEVQQQNADLQTLNTISAMMNRTLDLKQILQCAVEQTRTILHTEAAWLYLTDEEGLLRLQAQTGLSDAYTRGMHCLQPGQGLEGQVALENKADFVEDVLADSRNYKIWVDREGLTALAAVPLTRPGGQTSTTAVVGVLAVGLRANAKSLTTPPRNSWSPREVRLLTSIANQVALAINNAQLYARIQDSELSMRAGNEVLRTINDMLLEKTSFLEGFIQEELNPALTQAAQTLQRLLATPSVNLPDGHKQHLLNLQRLLSQLHKRAQETGQVSATLETEFNQTLEHKDQTGDYARTTKPPRLAKLKNESPPPPEPTRLSSPPLPTEGAPTPAKSTPLAPPKPMSFEEAVAAGLVPAHILNRETKPLSRANHVPVSAAGLD